MGGPARHAGLEVHKSRYPKAHRLHLRSDGTHFVDAAGEDVQGLLPVGATPLAVHAVMHDELLVDHAAPEVRAPRVDPDDPPWRHGGKLYNAG